MQRKNTVTIIICIVICMIIGFLGYGAYRENKNIQKVMGIKIRDDHYAKRPFALVQDDDFKNVYVIFGAYEPWALSEYEISRFVWLLNDIVIYQVDHKVRDDYVNEPDDFLIGGPPGKFYIETQEGYGFYIATTNSQIIINDTRYYAEKTTATALGEFHQLFREQIRENGKIQNSTDEE